jgi:hypothetical protein
MNDQGMEGRGWSFRVMNASADGVKKLAAELRMRHQRLAGKPTQPDTAVWSWGWVRSNLIDYATRATPRSIWSGCSTRRRRNCGSRTRWNSPEQRERSWRENIAVSRFHTRLTSAPSNPRTGSPVVERRGRTTAIPLLRAHSDLGIEDHVRGDLALAGTRWMAPRGYTSVGTGRSRDRAWKLGVFVWPIVWPMGQPVPFTSGRRRSLADFATLCLHTLQDSRECFRKEPGKLS